MNIKDGVIDCHCHLIQINPKFNTLAEVRTLSSLHKRLYKLWASKLVGTPWKGEVAELNRHLARKLNQVLETSQLTYAVVLALDGVYDARGELVHDHSVVYTSNQVLFDFVTATPKALAGYSINPMRKDAFDQLAWAVGHKGVLIKWLPGLQKFDPASARAVAFAKQCLAYNMPILTHAGLELSFPGMGVVGAFHKLSSLRPILETGCTVIVAHLAGVAPGRESAQLKKLEYLVQTYPNLYFDNSGMAVPWRKKRLMLAAKNDVLQTRVLYGSDYPVYSYPSAFVTVLGVKKTAQLTKLENPIDRDISIKHMLGFSYDSFTSCSKILAPIEL